jgi:type II secretory pathway pseudopilin PulG
MTARPSSGYVLIMLLFMIAAMTIGLMVAVPVWQTQIQREKEAELIFRGNQYVEAVRIFQLKTPGTFPHALDELIEEKCLRRHYEDPMNPDGDWNIILLPEAAGGALPSRGRSPGGSAGRPEQRRGGTFAVQKILVAPESALSSIRNPQILGVVSSSTEKSFRIYNEEESYDKWLFFYGHDPENPPEVVYYGRSVR